MILNLEETISLVKEDILRRFPNCSYTIRVLLWDDNTSLVECRHGNKNKLYISTYYNNKLEYEEMDITFINNTMVGEDGTIYYPKYQ